MSSNVCVYNQCFIFDIFLLAGEVYSMVLSNSHVFLNEYWDLP